MNERLIEEKLELISGWVREGDNILDKSVRSMIAEIRQHRLAESARAKARTWPCWASISRNHGHFVEAAKKQSQLEFVGDSQYESVKGVFVADQEQV